MKRLIQAAAACALAVAAPAMALPNAFWTFGWKFPDKTVPWTIGDTREDRPVEAVASLEDVATILPEPVAPAPVLLTSLLPYEFAGL